MALTSIMTSDVHGKINRALPLIKQHIQGEAERELKTWIKDTLEPLLFRRAVEFGSQLQIVAQERLGSPLDMGRTVVELHINFPETPD